VLSGRGLCDELITRPEESYRLWCVFVCDLEISRMIRSWPALGRSATAKKNTFIEILYMFRAVRCSSSGGLLVSMQHLILSLSVGDCSVHRLRKNRFFLNRCTRQSPTESDNIRCCIDTISPPEDEQHTARNM